jgi:serine acetyltransferase
MIHLIKSLRSPITALRFHIGLARMLYKQAPVLGKLYSFVVDPLVAVLYSVDMTSYTINVDRLSISHPIGVLLGGNGLVSKGHVVISSGVKFVGRSPLDPAYLERQGRMETFRLGDKVFVGVNTVLVGPIDICDGVVIGSSSLVNSDILESGTYVGVPARRIKSEYDESWFE